MLHEFAGISPMVCCIYCFCISAGDYNESSSAIRSPVVKGEIRLGDQAYLQPDRIARVLEAGAIRKPQKAAAEPRRKARRDAQREGYQVSKYP
jgi:hypothetical protein